MRGWQCARACDSGCCRGWRGAGGWLQEARGNFGDGVTLHADMWGLHACVATFTHGGCYSLHITTGFLKNAVTMGARSAGHMTPTATTLTQCANHLFTRQHQWARPRLKTRGAAHAVHTGRGHSFPRQSQRHTSELLFPKPRLPVVRGAGVPGQDPQQRLSSLRTSGLSHLGATHLASSQERLEFPWRGQELTRQLPLWWVGGH